MLITLLLAAQAAPVASPKPSDPVEADWVAIPDDDLLVMTLGNGRRVVIRLASRYTPAHVTNMRALARAKWWDGETLYRVQDNYVVQWGDATEKKPLPSGVIANPPAEYSWPKFDAVQTLSKADPYAKRAGYSADGWPVASNGTEAWLPHCYGMVGVARDLAPSTGSGGDLYTVIGHAPRHLDRNIAVVGRILEGMDALTTLPRGSGGGLGLYEDPKMYVPIASVRIASDLPAGERPRWQYRTPGNSRFAAWIRGRENREPPFFTVPSGGADICNALPPVRKAP
jgi:cyclophilin family peptidyl-prolyl cis-trans isomerase